MPRKSYPSPSPGAPDRVRVRPAQPLPGTIWLPDSARSPDFSTHDHPAVHAVLPDWAVHRIRVEFDRLGPSHAPSHLLRITVPEAEPGMLARTSHIPARPSRGEAEAPTVLLAEIHPHTLPPSGTLPGSGEVFDEDWPGFFHRAFRLLHGSGLLLIATRQHRDPGAMVDPLGVLTACARSAGFTYLQHIVIVHGHANADQIVPEPPDASTQALIHSDLLVFSPPQH